MLDRERILSKIDELEGYLSELHEILPSSFEEFRKIEKRRACERLLQVSIECVIDICGLIVAGLRLGLPGEEDDLFKKLEQKGLISNNTGETLKKMKGFRNILVHEYGEIDERIIYDMVINRLGDFKIFKKEVLQAIKKLA